MYQNSDILSASMTLHCADQKKKQNKSKSKVEVTSQQIVFGLFLTERTEHAQKKVRKTQQKQISAIAKAPTKPH